MSICPDNRRFAGLQAADILAFEIRRKVGELMGLDSSPKPRYPLTRLERDLKPHAWEYYKEPHHLRFNADTIERAALGKSNDALLTW